MCETFVREQNENSSATENQNEERNQLLSKLFYIYFDF